MFGGKTEAEESYAIIDRVLEAGINFLDTANVYSRGRSEEVTGEASIRATSFSPKGVETGTESTARAALTIASVCLTRANLARKSWSKTSRSESSASSGWISSPSKYAEIL